MKKISLLLVPLLVMLAGCSTGVKLVKVSPAERYNSVYSSGVEWGGEINHKSTNFLLSNLLLTRFEDNPDEVIRLLDQRSRTSKQRQLMQILTDLCSAVGYRHRRDPDKAVKYYCSSAYYSYRYLFDKSLTPTELPKYDPVVFFMTRYYNNALLVIGEYLKSKKMLKNDSFSLETATDMKLRFRKPLYDLPFPLKDYEDILFCPEYMPENLKTFSHSSGIGVPLIGVTRKLPPQNGLKSFAGMGLPVTMFLRFGGLVENDVEVQLEFYGTLHTDSIAIDGAQRKVPLELDFSSPVAYAMQNPTLFKGIAFMFNPAEIDKLAGLYTITPYDRNKIPVVMVHGLMSNPRTRGQMFNTLLNDPNIRKNYQFWFFGYSTGNPVLYSASLLREALLNCQKKCNPDGKNKKFSKMVIVAHSMGGLLSKTLIQNSGDTLSKGFFEHPMATVIKDLPEDQKAFIMQVMAFESLPFIQRVIFMATPHRGSEMAAWSIVRWTSSMITLPQKLSSRVHGIAESLMVKTKLIKERKLKLSTGIDNLDPDDKSLLLLNEIPFSGNVPFHTVCGNNAKAGVPGGTDGIVPYWSSHLDGAMSELIVKFGHSVQEDEAAIEEVRRILLLHLKDNGLLEENSSK